MHVFATPCAISRVPPPHSTSAPVVETEQDDLPLDPRAWGRGHVSRWVSRGGGRPERFPCNGKALCLMSQAMFTARVPRDGARLHQDFRRRLARAIALQELLEKLQKAANRQ